MFDVTILEKIKETTLDFSQGSITDTQLNKLKFVAKRNAETILRILWKISRFAWWIIFNHKTKN